MHMLYKCRGLYILVSLYHKPSKNVLITGRTEHRHKAAYSTDSAGGQQYRITVPRWPLTPARTQRGSALIIISISTHRSIIPAILRQ